MLKQSILKKNNKYNVYIDVIIVKEDNYYVAYCPSLDLSAYADSIEKAERAFEKNLEIFLDETAQKGTFEKILLNLGWTLKLHPKPDYKPPLKSFSALKRKFKSKPEHSFKEQIAIPI